MYGICISGAVYLSVSLPSPLPQTTWIHGINKFLKGLPADSLKGQYHKGILF
jgi:hypothetical protein